MITLLTDFGRADHFAGVLHGVIATIAPAERVVDITHEVPPFAIATGAFLLEQAWRYFPAGTIHVGIVDPGVGSERRPLLVSAGGHHFVGPDNGLFSFLYGLHGAKVRVLNKARYWLPETSNTFHGRDIFAPVAAHLATGITPARLGKLITDAQRTPALNPVRHSRRAWTGAVLHVDCFGNLITNYRVTDFPALRQQPFTLTVGLEQTDIFASTYAASPPEVLCVIPGSSGYYEVALASSSAARRTGLVAGSPLELTLG
jgi:S-adenosylmethionine hydrolase